MIYFIAITELPCKTDGFAGNYDDDQTTPCNNEGMVFCYQNGSDLLWEKILKFEAERQKFAKFLRLQIIYSTSERSEQFLVTECFFNLFLEVSNI